LWSLVVGYMAPEPDGVVDNVQCPRVWDDTQQSLADNEVAQQQKQTVVPQRNTSHRPSLQSRYDIDFELRVPIFKA
jgi:hypothetical protein